MSQNLERTTLARSLIRRALRRQAYGTGFDVHPDGHRIAMAKVSDTRDTQRNRLVFVFNFFDELRRVSPQP